MATKSTRQIRAEIDEAMRSPGSRSLDALLPGGGVLWQAALSTTAARAHRLRRWSADDQAALKALLEYVRRSYKVPGATYPRLVPYGMGSAPAVWQLGSYTVSDREVATFTSFEVAQAAASIARQAAEILGLAM